MDVRELDRRALAALDEIVRDLRPEDLIRRTPCEGWDLADLLRHQVSENHGFAIALRKGSAPDWHSGTLGEDAYRSYAASVEEYLNALDDDGLLDRQVTVGEFGAFPGHVAVSMHLVDSVAHGWDIAKSLGRPFEPASEALQAALRIAEQIPADPEFRLERGTFGAVVEVGAEASELDRLVALLGRSPDWR
ncbi:TIGR03086 family metal-binding protein [Amycolatopsis taiwanensis]|uniref:TIGR03086 family protein n=1 Tax=Amycolatopsis taiwanensis TaxID=342230 RepID=A0A9W6R283_9PSEU|nr:TIGR03086 family metal-binding protein [Amycolatopsis taiwanensis]GLY66317.1 TIGR03086 family protein [Amycolatopsis taiwanensis]